MLHAMRKGASGWLAKGLLLLLVASFGLWGIGSDMLGSSAGSDVIEVGDETITIGEFQREYQNQIVSLSNVYRQRISREQARQLGLLENTVRILTDRLLLSEKAKALGLGATDAAVLDEIRNGPTFKNEAGVFDRFRFQEYLRQTGYSEAEFVEVLRKDLMRQQLLSTFALDPSVTPEILVDTLFNYQQEKRSASYIELANSNVKNAPAPTDDQLQTFIEENPQAYTAPEYRKASFISLTPELFTSQVSVTDAEMIEEYEGRKNEFDIPENRHIQQMIFEDEATAKAAAALISAGSEFATVAKDQLQLTPEDIDLGETGKAELFEELQEPVFSVLVDGVTPPVKTDLGWHLVKVTKITPAKLQTLEEVKDRIKRSVALRKAVDIVYEKSTALEDEFAGGATIEEAAKAADVPVTNTDWIDAGGLTPNGTPATKLPATPEFLPELFAKAKDADIDLTETRSGNYFAVSTVDIKPSALKALTDVKNAATSAWTANWQKDENQKLAEALLEKLKSGTSLEDAATSANVTVKTADAALRSRPAQGFSAKAAEDLFGLKEGDYALAANASGSSYLLFTVKEIVSADKEKAKTDAENIRNGVLGSIQRDALEQYQSYLEKTYGVNVKMGLIREFN